MRAGKLPADLLGSLLSRVQQRDPRVLVGPGIGNDASVIDAGGGKLLVVKSDPITFASTRIGWYAVHVNANDIACMGARPSWFLATILLPEGADRSLARSIFRDIQEACSSVSAELVGGHTEITYGIDRPIVCGAMVGEVERERLVRPDGARAGDALIMTKGIAIEGTSVLAQEVRPALLSLGVSARQISAARRYVHDPGISVMREAAAVTDAVRVHAMHDATEGGLATALREMAVASGLGIEVWEDRIIVLPATERVCRAADLDPLGLLASGALLIAVSATDELRSLDALAASGVAGRTIGRFTTTKRVIMDGNSRRRPVPRFKRDEVARFLSGQERRLRSNAEGG
jgi:hydrogenase maturation factor